MTGWLVAHAGGIYVAAVVGAFAAVALWETLSPLRPGSMPLGPRWRVNLLLLFIDNLMVRAALPVAAVAAASQAEAQGWGLLAQVDLPMAAKAVIGIVLLDLARWSMHWAFHRLPWLWRLHQVHHSDLEMDCTVSLRFHPLDAVLTGAAQVAAVMALGVPPAAVLMSDVLTVALGLAAHANASLPPRLERLASSVLVTPASHRVHHSSVVAESMSNLGVLFSFWDRLFGTHLAAPAAGHLRMTLGLDDLRDPARLTLPRLLWLPFRAQAVRRRDAEPATLSGPPA